MRRASCERRESTGSRQPRWAPGAEPVPWREGGERRKHLHVCTSGDGAGERYDTPAAGGQDPSDRLRSTLRQA